MSVAPGHHNLSVYEDGDLSARTAPFLQSGLDAGEPVIVGVAQRKWADEVFAGARRHGNGVSGVRVGRVDGRSVCEPSDRGAGVQDPLTGFLPARPGHANGAGLWMARRLTARLDFPSSPEGFATRLWV